jgi:hypothetical protein
VPVLCAALQFTVETTKKGEREGALNGKYKFPNKQRKATLWFLFDTVPSFLCVYHLFKLKCFEDQVVVAMISMVLLTMLHHNRSTFAEKKTNRKRASGEWKSINY